MTGRLRQPRPRATPDPLSCRPPSTDPHRQETDYSVRRPWRAVGGSFVQPVAGLPGSFHPCRPSAMAGGGLPARRRQPAPAFTPLSGQQLREVFQLAPSIGEDDADRRLMSVLSSMPVEVISMIALVAIFLVATLLPVHMGALALVAA